MERPRARRWAAALGVAAAWAAAVPEAGRAVGLRLDVPARLEVADHAVPGAVVLAAALLLARAGGEVALGSLRWALAGGATTLAGAWIAATHAPLIAEAADGVTGWGPALLHVSAAVPVLVLGMAMLVLPVLRDPAS